MKRLGGWIVHYAFEVGNVGRMAVLEDPQGAVFAVWQPRTRIGAERIGCLCINGLITTDIDAARAFYERLFGWTIDISDATLPGSNWTWRESTGAISTLSPAESGDRSVGLARFKSPLAHHHDRRPHLRLNTTTRDRNPCG